MAADLERLVGRVVDRRLTAFSLAPDGGGTDRTRDLASDFKVPLRLAQTDPRRRPARPAQDGVIADSFTQFAAPYLAATFKT